MSLIGSHDAYTSWSATAVLPTQTYDNSQDVQYVAPQAPVVVTNPTTNVGTVLDSDFIDQIVRRNQENIYDSSKAQKIAILTDENGIAYGKQLHIDLLTVKTTTHDTLLATHTTNISTNAALLVAHTASIAANNAFMVQTDDSLTQDIDANTTLLATHTVNIAGNGVAIGDNANNISNNMTSIDANIADINAIRDDMDNVIVPNIGNAMGAIGANTASIGTNTASIQGHTTSLASHTASLASHTASLAGHAASLASQASTMNHLNVTQTTMNANIFNQISNQVTNRTLTSNGTVVRESIDARFNLYGLDTETVVRGEFYGNFTSGANNVKGHVRKASFYDVNGTSVLHNDVTFVFKEGDYWKMTRYYWNPMSQTADLSPGRYGANTLPEMRYVPDALNNVMPIGDITNTDDLTAEVIHSNFWTHANVNTTGNGQIIQNSVFTYHMRNLVYTPTTERIALKSVQDTILTTLAKKAEYQDYGWSSTYGYVNQERRLPADSVIYAGDSYKTRETTQQSSKLIPYLDDTGRLNSAFIWSPEFDHAVFGANNPEKNIPISRGGGQSNYVAGFVPTAENVPDAFRYEYFLNSQGVWSNGYTQQLNGITSSFQNQINQRIDAYNALVISTNQTENALYAHIHGPFSNFANKLGDVANEVANIDTNTGKAQKDDMVIFGDNAAITASPAAIGYINDKGRLNTARLFDQIFNDQVFGVEDPDTVSARRKSNAYLPGLVPTAENVTDRTTKYLRADGTWVGGPISAQPTFEKLIVSKTGSQETIGLFQSTDNDCSVRIEGRGEAYLELSNTSPSNGSAANAWGIGVNDSNRLEFNWKPKGTTLNPIQNTLTLTHDGKVGIKRLVPTAELDVAGTVKATTFIGDGSSLTGLPDLSIYDTSAQVDAKITAIPAATKLGNMNIQKLGTDYTFLYHGNISNYDGIRFGAGGMFQLNSGGGGTPTATMEFRVDNQLYAVFSRPSNNIQFLKSTSFTNDIRWNPSGLGEVSLSVLYTDVEAIKSDYQTSAQVDAKISAIPLPNLSSYDTSSQVDTKIDTFSTGVLNPTLNALYTSINVDADTKIAAALQNYDTSTEVDTKIDTFSTGVLNPTLNALYTSLNVDADTKIAYAISVLPDFDTITSANKFCITNTANGGTISYVTPTTSDVNEGTNLYYTDDRVNARVTTALQGGEIANIVSNIIQAQTVVANSDIRLKDEIRPIEESHIGRLNPVEYIFKKDPEKRLRYGFIAQEVEDIYPELIHEKDDIKSINYLDMIALLVKENQDLKKNMINMTHILMVLEERLTRNCIF